MIKRSKLTLLHLGTFKNSLFTDFNCWNQRCIFIVSFRKELHYQTCTIIMPLFKMQYLLCIAEFSMKKIESYRESTCTVYIIQYTERGVVLHRFFKKKKKRKRKISNSILHSVATSLSLKSSELRAHIIILLHRLQ